jgi:hypothetical protein
MDAHFVGQRRHAITFFSLSTAIRRSDRRYLLTRFFATCSSFPCQVSQKQVSHFVGSVHPDNLADRQRENAGNLSARLPSCMGGGPAGPQRWRSSQLVCRLSDCA